jgi:hypothetical protein
MTEAYILIANHIKKNLPWVKHIDKFNDQILTIEEEIDFALPAVFIELGRFIWKTTGPTTQKGEGQIRIHLVQDTEFINSHIGSRTQDKVLALMDRYKEVHRCLQGLQCSAYFSALDRIESEEDEIYGPVNIFIQTYATVLFEDTLRETDYETLENLNVEIDIRQDNIENKPGARIDLEYHA